MNLRLLRYICFASILESCGDDPSYQHQEEPNITLNEGEHADSGDSRAQASGSKIEKENTSTPNSPTTSPTPIPAAIKSCEDVYRETVDPTFTRNCANCHEYIPSFELSPTETLFNFEQYQRVFVGNEETMLAFFSTEGGEGGHPGGPQPEITSEMMAKMKDACD